MTTALMMSKDAKRAELAHAFDSILTGAVNANLHQLHPDAISCCQFNGQQCNLLNAQPAKRAS